MAGVAAVGLVAIGAPGPGQSNFVNSLFTPDTSVEGAVLLIRHIRDVIKATLPELKSVPENINTFLTFGAQGLQTPFMVLLPKAPRPGEAAVNDDLQILTFEFVYVIENVNALIPDIQEYIRNRLNTLKRALLSDYRQGGLANATRLIQDPIDHLNQYNHLFAQEAQPVTALYLTMEFDVIEQRISA